MERTEQLEELFRLVYAKNMSIVKACAAIGIPHSTFYAIPEGERKDVEERVLDSLHADRVVENEQLDTLKHEAEQRVITSLTERMDRYLDVLDGIILDEEVSAFVRMQSIKVAADIARAGVFIQNLPMLPAGRPQLAAPAQQVQPGPYLIPAPFPKEVSVTSEDGSTFHYKAADRAQVVDNT